MKTLEVELNPFCIIWLKTNEAQGVECGLNESCSHRLVYLNVWFPDGGLFKKVQQVWSCGGRCEAGSGL